MAVRVTRPEPPIPATIERIRQHRRPAKQAPPDREALASVREVVRHSNSVEHAIAAITAINAAWSDISNATREAIRLLLTILELSSSVHEALAVFSRVVSDYAAALKTLEATRSYLASHYPDAVIRIEAGDTYYQVSKAWLYVLVPADTYKGFKAIRDHLIEWWHEMAPDIGGLIEITPRRKATDV